VTELAELQRFMAELLQKRRALPRDPEIVEQARRFISGNERLSPVEQLEIYREQFWLRHTGSLVEDFPGLGGIIGQAAWQRLVEDYLEAHPPTSHTLRDLGSHLPEHVERATYLEHHELCVDMARLEWLYIELFDAPDVPSLDPEKLAAIPAEAWEHARISLNPALALLEVRFPVAELRTKLREAREPVAIPEALCQQLVLYRRERNLYHLAVDAAPFALLSELRQGTPLVSACERTVAASGDSATLEQNLFAWFRQWGELGWIVDVDV
jgi:hypothetical protein